MKEHQLRIQYRSTTDTRVFEPNVQELIKQTIAFAANAYAPYSNFKVSAALLLENGKILKGTNVENASYPVCICAERTLLSHAISNYPTDKISIMAIYVDKDLPAPVPPCGLCRQSLVEAEARQNQKFKILLISKSGTILQFESCGDLLPLAFSGDFLQD